MMPTFGQEQALFVKCGRPWKRVACEFLTSRRTRTNTKMNIRGLHFLDHVDHPVVVGPKPGE